MHHRIRSLSGSSLVLLFCFVAAGSVFGQIREEKEEKTLEARKLQKAPSGTKLSSQAAVFFGYDSNPYLSPLKKSDTFEELLYALGWRASLGKGFSFTFNYDLDVLNYDETTDLSNALNHFRFGLHKKISKFTVGTGYDVSLVSYFHNKQGDFFFHKGFFYVRQKLTKKLYHQLLWEAGLKEHLDRKALDETISAYQNKDLTDRRQSVEYTIGAALTKKLGLKFRSKFTVNDSNARYLDFYDYKSYQFTPSLDYKLTDRLTAAASYTYLRKDYESRTTVAAAEKQKDNIQAASFKVSYKVNPGNTLSLLYSWRTAESNEDIEEYTQHVVACGWQYNF